MQLNFNSGAMIDSARSTVATWFLEGGHGDVLLFIDDDILFTPEDVYQIVQDAIQYQTVVGATYRTKNPYEIRFATEWKDNNPITIGPGGEIKEVLCAATGFMAIPRKVLEDLSKTLPRLHNTPGGPWMHPFFQPYYPDGITYWSEDCAFCYRVRELGYKIFVDTSIHLKHVGLYEYESHGIFEMNEDKSFKEVKEL